MKKKWEQQDLAAIIGINKATISYWETTKRTPSQAQLALIAEATGGNLNWLITGEGEPFSDQQQTVATPSTPTANSITPKEAEMLWKELKELRKLVTIMNNNYEIVNNNFELMNSLLRSKPNAIRVPIYAPVKKAA